MTAAETQIWFVEELVGGKYVPATYRGAEPERKRVSGRNRVFRNDPVKVHHAHRNLTLKQLFEVYSPDGRFQTSKATA